MRSFDGGSSIETVDIVVPFGAQYYFETTPKTGTAKAGFCFTDRDQARRLRSPPFHSMPVSATLTSSHTFAESLSSGTSW
jgi:hypothetical protein